ncbi:uncharacterized protein CIMG_01421 [Coccidioides immitis RS]|uniref:Uncharacterized protein n=1 Tax=Coccidioides immitis (strain RS) TaxID=246410 RepID=J3KJ64_COCIM|nr:uncharacterized protein CIMG_01421 [Coccidioides immitis RS]EAS36067.3 hypothetical protein CIMG_01421 [Coccidioides immitis RS]
MARVPQYRKGFPSNANTPRAPWKVDPASTRRANCVQGHLSYPGANIRHSTGVRSGIATTPGDAILELHRRSNPTFLPGGLLFVFYCIVNRTTVKIHQTYNISLDKKRAFGDRTPTLVENAVKIIL